MNPETGSSSFYEKIKAAFFFMLVVMASMPMTLLIPLPLTILLTRRYKREVLLKKIHFMVPWAKFVVKCIIFARVHINGKENLVDDSRGYMFICNHQSYIDTPILAAALNTIAFLSKDLVKYIPIIGLSAYAGGTLFFSRGNHMERKMVLDETMRMCVESTAVVVFPEGTRSGSGNLREKIYPGSILECYRRKIKIIPVAIDGTYLIFPKTMDRLNLGKTVTVEIGRAVDPEDYADEKSFMDKCWGDVRTLHETCKISRADLERPS